MKRIMLAFGLVTMLLLLAARVSRAEPTYIGAVKCKMCHKVQYESWLETRHAKATETARAGKDRDFEQGCLACHATNRDENLTGVQCEACHGPGSDYKSIQVMKDRQKAIAAGLVIPAQATCDGCHDGNDHHKTVVFDRSVVHAHKK